MRYRKFAVFALVLGQYAAFPAFAERNFSRTIDFAQSDVAIPKRELSERMALSGFMLGMSDEALEAHYKGEGFQIVQRNSSEPELEYGITVENLRIDLNFNSFVNNATFSRRTKDFYSDNVTVYFLPGDSGAIYALTRYASSMAGAFGANETWKSLEDKLGTKLDVEDDGPGVQFASVIFSSTGMPDASGRCSDGFGGGIGPRGNMLDLDGYSVRNKDIEVLRSFVNENCAFFFSANITRDSSGLVSEMSFRSVDGLALLKSMEENNKLGSNTLDELEREAREWLNQSRSKAPDL